jgi:putative SOS response-associated peptidase YedK
VVRNLVDEPTVEARYNIAPMQMAPVAREGIKGRRADRLRWGLIPSWARDEKIAGQTLNARCETVAVKPAFRSAFKTRRCLVPSSGFYEWQTVAKEKRPFWLRPASGGLFAFAGLWDVWRNRDGLSLETFTILTTEANEVVRPYHERMPVVVAPSDFHLWLDPSRTTSTDLEPLFRPLRAADMIAVAVSPLVNNVRNEGPRCLEPPATSAGRSLFEA